NRPIVAPGRPFRRGADYVRQQLSIQEHFWRGNALVTLIVARQAAVLKTAPTVHRACITTLA
ncbi:hypothetical protein, partial [Bradyrhizobium sp. 190]|uniref:hypothetical protein n=1 Tax=Bradyrhizobium sp. 190 TaxID=2782658 RepID=UPI001FFB30FD